MLCTSLPEHQSFNKDSFEGICLAIYDAAGTFVVRLLMPLRTPASIAAITDRSKLQDQMQGAALCEEVAAGCLTPFTAFEE